MRRLILALLLLASCDRRPAATPAGNDHKAKPEREAAVRPPAEASSAETQDSGDAAEALRRYYGLIESGDYEAAWNLRSGKGVDLERFAANFKAYERYRAKVGPASRPVRQGEWLYVEVPVMITGRFRGGKPFGSAGSVSLRRGAPGTQAGAAQPGWRIFTG